MNFPEASAPVVPFFIVSEISTPPVADNLQLCHSSLCKVSSELVILGNMAL